MSELQLIDQRSGTTVGLITLAADGTVTADTGRARGVFSQYRKYFDSDRAAFERFAGGWSNGYLRIPPLTD